MVMKERSRCQPNDDPNVLGPVAHQHFQRNEVHRFNSHRPEALIHPSGIASPNAFMVKAYPSKAPFLDADCRLMTVPCQSEYKNDTELDAIRLDATGGQDN